MEKKIEKEIKKEMKNMKSKKHHRKMKGGEIVQPTVNPSTGIEEIPIQDFAAYQQALIAGYPPQMQVQDLTTVPYGQLANTVADLASLIPEIGPIIDLAKEATNALIGIFYKPKSTIANRLKSEGVDIFLDNVMLVNPAKYPSVKKSEGQAFIDWLISKNGQDVIASYQIGGEQLFFPNAKQ